MQALSFIIAPGYTGKSTRAREGWPHWASDVETLADYMTTVTEVGRGHPSPQWTITDHQIWNRTLASRALSALGSHELLFVHDLDIIDAMAEVRHHLMRSAIIYGAVILSENELLRRIRNERRRFMNASHDEESRAELALRAHRQLRWVRWARVFDSIEAALHSFSRFRSL